MKHWRQVAVALALAGSLLPAAEPTSRTESFPAGIQEMYWGSLELQVPHDWDTGWSASNGAYRFMPAGDAEFILLVTPLPDMTSRSIKQRCAKAQKTAEQARSGLRSTAEEKEIPIRKLDGPAVCMRFVTVTDKTVTEPTPEDLKYATRGGMAVGHLLATFTILSNRQDHPAHDVVLEMLRNARHEGGPADDSATAAAATRLSFPGRDWGILVDFEGFEIGSPEPRKGGAAIKFSAEAEDAWVTIFYEQADRGNDPKTYRAYYRETSFKAAPLERENIRESERDGMVLLGYTVLHGGNRYPNVNAFWVRDGLWIDVHMSTVGSGRKAAVRFDRFLDAIRFDE